MGSFILTGTCATSTV